MLEIELLQHKQTKTEKTKLSKNVGGMHCTEGLYKGLFLCPVAVT